MVRRTAQCKHPNQHGIFILGLKDELGGTAVLDRKAEAVRNDFDFRSPENVDRVQRMAIVRFLDDQIGALDFAVTGLPGVEETAFLAL
jgi:hypothetical protein